MTQEKATLAGMIGPATFALVVVVLTLVQYNFMVGLGCTPSGAPTYLFLALILVSIEAVAIRLRSVVGAAGLR
jgi:hypothetical protein